MSMPHLFSSRHHFAMVLVTVGRVSLLRAVRSIFKQNYTAPIQVLIGVDVDLEGNLPVYQQQLASECPPNITLTWLNLGYSTSKRHGGVHDCYYGGSLRCALTFLADAYLVSYLDDDDWLLPDHVASMVNVFQQYPDISWAHPLCYYADGNDGRIFCLDETESVGVDKGIYHARFGGFVRPSGLTLNKIATLPYLHCLAEALTVKGDGEDRLLFAQLRSLPHCTVNRGTVCYALDPKDAAHSFRLNYIQQKTGQTVELKEKTGSVR